MTFVEGDDSRRLKAHTKQVMLAALVVALLGAGWFLTRTHGPIHRTGGDPGSIRQRALTRLSAVLPDDRIDNGHEYDAPKWGSCDGFPASDGWSSAYYDYFFTSESSAKQVVAQTSTRMSGLSWTPVASSSRDPEAIAEWTTPLATGVTARASLSYGPGVMGPKLWRLVAEAPPAGRQNGC